MLESKKGKTRLFYARVKKKVKTDNFMLETKNKTYKNTSDHSTLIKKKTSDRFML